MEDQNLEKIKYSKEYIELVIKNIDQIVDKILKDVENEPQRRH